MPAQLQLDFYHPAHPVRWQHKPPSAKLREARDLLRQLMLCEFTLTESVADRLEGLALRLDDLAWKQELFERPCQ